MILYQHNHTMHILHFQNLLMYGPIWHLTERAQHISLEAHRKFSHAVTSRTLCEHDTQVM